MSAHTKTVIEVITDRMLAKNSGVEYHDDYHLTLGVEGGAMRGIISEGMLLALYDLGMLDVFDDYVGTSAGSLNLCYTLAGQGALGLSVYLEDMPSKDIVNLLRFRSELHPMMDMRRLYIRTTEDKQLDLPTLREKYGNNLYIAVSNITKNRGELFTLKSAGIRFQELLVAGALMPFVAGEPWIVKQNEYFDGGMYYIEPAECLPELGSTHALILNTQPQDIGVKPWGSLVERKIRSLNKQHPGAGSLYLSKLQTYCETINKLPHGETEYRGQQLYRHALKTSVGVGRLTMDHDKLVEGVKAGYKSIIDIFYGQGRVGILPTLM
ncbi:MAG: hypothetical protein JWN38_3 [Candidatus Saccharibacteria bacterium]|nr:hypothetical protein [Candidatus Saccharibacteria bacterium]